VAVLTNPIITLISAIVEATLASYTPSTSASAHIGARPIASCEAQKSIHSLKSARLCTLSLPPRPPPAALGASAPGPSAPALRLPVRWTGLSMTLVGGSGSRSGSSSGSLPFHIHMISHCSFEKGRRVKVMYPGARRGSVDHTHRMSAQCSPKFEVA
jgi:hypothetical protein